MKKLLFQIICCLILVMPGVSNGNVYAEGLTSATLKNRETVLKQNIDQYKAGSLRGAGDTGVFIPWDNRIVTVAEAENLLAQYQEKVNMNDAMLQKIAKILSDNKSPMLNEEGFVKAAFDACVESGVDPRFLIGITKGESSYGRKMRCVKNPWNWHCVGNERKAFKSYAEGARTVAVGIRKIYLNGGVWTANETRWMNRYYEKLIKAGYIKGRKLSSLSEIAWIYVTEPNAWKKFKNSMHFAHSDSTAVNNWINHCAAAMVDLGGDPSTIEYR
jgi:hypothetical protein